MKIKMLSPEALAALASGTQLNAVAPDAGADGGDGTPAAGVVPGVETTEAAAADGTEPSEGASAETTAQVESLTTQVAELTAGLAASTGRVAELEAALADMSTRVTTAEASVKAAGEEASEYRGIVEAQFAGMRLALGLSAVDTKNWTNEALLREYGVVAESFERSLPEGPQVPETKPSEQKTPPMSSLAAGAFEQLGF